MQRCPAHRNWIPIPNLVLASLPAAGSLGGDLGIELPTGDELVPRQLENITIELL